MAGWDEVIFVPDDDQITVSRNTAPINVVAVLPGTGFAPGGLPGEDGEDGFSMPGSVGPQGVQGPQGPPASGVMQGDDGDDGFSMPGSVGPQGVAGPQGPVGSPVQGDDGDDAFPIPGPAGTLANASPLSFGFTYTSFNAGTQSSGTFTPSILSGNLQYYTNGGAHTLAAPSADGLVEILVTNNASAGAITFSGFTVGSGVGDALTTTNTNKFMIRIRRINSVSAYFVQALQ